MGRTGSQDRVLTDVEVVPATKTLDAIDNTSPKSGELYAM